MCDYSLYGVASRPAEVGDKLVTTHFTNSFTRGFAAVGAPNVAVCLRPGTELAFEKNAVCKAAYGFLPDREIGEKAARFRQINREWPNTHHDALEFASGEIVLLTRMIEGQHATVLQLPAGVHDEKAAEPAQETREPLAL
jgi:hypothetical protein